MRLPGYCSKCAASIPKSRRYCDACRPPSKYGNKIVHDDGLRFDSKAEHKRYCQLKVMQLGGKIHTLEVHPRCDLTVNGKKVGVFTPDFRYVENGRGVVVEDVKGMSVTADFRLRANLFEAIYGVPVNVVRP